MTRGRTGPQAGPIVCRDSIRKAKKTGRMEANASDF